MDSLPAEPQGKQDQKEINKIEKKKKAIKKINITVLSRALWDSRAGRPFYPPFLVGKTPDFMIFSEFQRAEQLLIKGELATNPPEARLKGPERLLGGPVS